MNLSSREVKLSLVCQIFLKSFEIGRQIQNGNENVIPEMVLDYKIEVFVQKQKSLWQEKMTLEGTWHQLLPRFPAAFRIDT